MPRALAPYATSAYVAFPACASSLVFCAFASECMENTSECLAGVQVKMDKAVEELDGRLARLCGEAMHCAAAAAERAEAADQVQYSPPSTRLLPAPAVSLPDPLALLRILHPFFATSSRAKLLGPNYRPDARRRRCMQHAQGSRAWATPNAAASSRAHAPGGTSREDRWCVC